MILDGVAWIFGLVIVWILFLHPPWTSEQSNKVLRRFITIVIFIIWAVFFTWVIYH